MLILIAISATYTFTQAQSKAKAPLKHTEVTIYLPSTTDHGVTNDDILSVTTSEEPNVWWNITARYIDITVVDKPYNMITITFKNHKVLNYWVYDATAYSDINELEMVKNRGLNTYLCILQFPAAGSTDVTFSVDGGTVFRATNTVGWWTLYIMYPSQPTDYILRTTGSDGVSGAVRFDREVLLTEYTFEGF